MKILLSIILILILLFVAINIYLSIKYSYVNSGLRFMGWLISAFTSYNDEKGLRRFASMANTFMPILFRYKSEKMIAKKVFIKGQDGNSIPVVIYKSKNTKPDATGFLWIHGGGYCIGTPGAEKNFLAPFVLNTNTVAVVPDYRLSVKAPYPAAFNDCCDTLIWMEEHANELGINESQIFVGGASAGGGLATAITLYARDSGKVNIAFQMPIYPMINDKMDTASMIGNTEMLWNEKQNHAAWQVYLGELYDTEQVPYYAAPARTQDYSNLPSAYSFIGTLDPFYDETLRYMKALKKAGIAASYDIYETAFHGFDVIPSKISKKARSKLLEEYRYAQEHYFAPQE